MLIEEYGFIVFYNGKRFSNLEDGLPEPDFGSRVEIRYNSEPFTTYTENNAHISCSVTYLTQVFEMSPFTSSTNVMVEKNRLYKKWGRESTMLSKILYALGGKKLGESDFASPSLHVKTVELMGALRRLIEEKYHNIYAVQREEKDVC